MFMLHRFLFRLIFLLLENKPFFMVLFLLICQRSANKVDKNLLLSFLLCFNNSYEWFFLKIDIIPKHLQINLSK